MVAKNEDICKQRIHSFEITEEKLTERGGISLFVRYLESIGIYGLILPFFEMLKKTKKGTSIGNIFKQIMCFFFDGTNFSLTRFDELAANEAYAESIENNKEAMCSSHTIKRFLGAFKYFIIWRFRVILQKLFIWRLKITKPTMIILNIDSMVMDNDDSERKEGVKPTYKKVKGFHPLQLSWNNYIIDAIFRGGSVHGNHGDAVLKMVRHIVNLIREEYNANVAIMIRCDSAFFDESLFKDWDKLGIGFICAGKMYEDLKEDLSFVHKEDYALYETETQSWEYIEFFNRRASWNKPYRTIYYKPLYEGRQQLLEFARPDRLLYTNIGMNKKIDCYLKNTDNGIYRHPEQIISLYHQRGEDELTFRALKDFGTEHLPCKRFESNAAYYYLMLIAFFLFESFKEDVTAPIIRLKSYATTVRRIIVDIAAKIVHKAGRVCLKITRAIADRLHIFQLWHNCNHVSPIIIS